MPECFLEITNNEEAKVLCGDQDQHLKQTRQLLGIEIVLRDGTFRFMGSASGVAQGKEMFSGMLRHYRKTGISQDADMAFLFQNDPKGTNMAYELKTFLPGRIVNPKTSGQIRYVEAMAGHDVVFATGPAGTGKTYLAVAAAVDALKKDLTQRIILVRPVVEAGESLGFLPGDIQAKVHPYVSPLMDALHEMIEESQIAKLTESSVIEVVPLAYMRGRNLHHAFIILDEAQNCTSRQMKMLLTRLGVGSRLVITGDPTQTDLSEEVPSGLDEAHAILDNIPEIAFVTLLPDDIVRHPLVQKVVRAYEANNRKARHGL